MADDPRSRRPLKKSSNNLSSEKKEAPAPGSGLRGEAVPGEENRYRNILETMEEVYYEVDLKGKLTFFNSTAVKRLGFSNEEIMGMSYLSFTDRESAARLLDAHFRVYSTGEPVRALEWVFVNKYGERLPVESSVSLLRDSEGAPWGSGHSARHIRAEKDRGGPARQPGPVPA
jgi:PAS domain S-box-containing protein